MAGPLCVKALPSPNGILPMLGKFGRFLPNIGKTKRWGEPGSPRSLLRGVPEPSPASRLPTLPKTALSPQSRASWMQRRRPRRRESTCSRGRSREFSDRICRMDRIFGGCGFQPRVRDALVAPAEKGLPHDPQRVWTWNTIETRYAGIEKCEPQRTQRYTRNLTQRHQNTESFSTGFTGWTGFWGMRLPAACLWGENEFVATAIPREIP